MAPWKAVKVQKTRNPTQSSKNQAIESEKYSHDSSADESYSEKDETEKRLEKLIFGDEAGFLESIKSHQPENAQLILTDEWEDHPEDQDEDDLDNVPDGDLFFLDSGAGTISPRALVASKSADQLNGASSSKHSAWFDSDDERIMVSLASNTRLRKLRRTEGEDVINGTEYIRRLREQYQQLHPMPQWATQARVKSLKRKRERRDSATDTGSDSNASSSIEDDLSTTSTRPLAELLRCAGSLTTSGDGGQDQRKRQRRLRTEVIDIQKTKSVSGQGPSSVESLQFHPYYPLLLSSGPASTIYLHQISPLPQNPNPLLTSLHMKKMSLYTTAFCIPLPESVTQESAEDTVSHDRTMVILSSRRRYFHTWSLSTGTISKIARPLTTSSPLLRAAQRTMERFKPSPCGRYVGLIGSSRKGGGNINVLSTSSWQWVCSCRIDSQGGVADFAWWRDGSGLTVAGKNGGVSEFDVQERRIVGRWVDEGAVGTTVIAAGGGIGGKIVGGNRWVAVGSSSGIVNIYDRREWISPGSKTSATMSIPSNPKPIRSLHQLTTPISHLLISSDGQMLVMASRWKRDSLRLVHLPSCTIYRNWPTSNTPLGRISSVALSANGSLLAVGNEQGRIRLWEIRD